MFDYFKSHKIVTGVIVFLLAIPFAFFGLEYYARDGAAAGRMAEVDGTPISAQEFAQALQSRQEQLRQSMGGRVDQAMLDSPEVRKAVLDALVDQQVSYRAAIDAGIRVSDAELRQVIAELPAFRENEGTGPFSRALYEAALRNRGMSEQSFEALLRRDLMVGRLRTNLAASAFVPGEVLDRIYRIRSQQREVSQAEFDPARLQAKVKIEDSELQAYFDAHKDEFKIPERIKAEYAVLSFDHIQRQIQVAPEALAAAYEERKAAIQGAEERRARHILVSVEEGASPEQKAEARKRAEELLVQARSAPAEFADLAMKHSEDPGSAFEGGDLGFVPRKQMVQPFDDAMFSMREGGIAGPVETRYGFHVIKLESIRSAPVPTFDEMKAQLEADLRKQEANKRFAEAAEEFSNLVYEQPDTLEPVADRFGIEVQKSDWLSPMGSEDAPLLNHEKVLTALFKEDVIEERRNIEATEVAPTLLLSARVIDHQASQQRTLDEVRGEVVQRLTQEKAAQLAKTQGEAALAALRKGDRADLSWTAPEMINRDQRQGAIPPEAAQAVFSADTAKLPAYVGHTLADGRFVVFRISRVVEASSINPEQRKALGSQVEQMVGMESAVSAVVSQRQKADVKINAQALEGNS